MSTNLNGKPLSPIQRFIVGISLLLLITGGGGLISGTVLPANMAAATTLAYAGLVLFVIGMVLIGATFFFRCSTQSYVSSLQRNAPVLFRGIQDNIPRNPL
jgi:hypothetical protein